MTEANFRLKGSVVTTVLLEIDQFSLPGIRQQLMEKVEQAPQFFEQAPLIIDFSRISVPANESQVRELIDLLNELRFSPIGWRATTEQKEALMALVPLPYLPPSKGRGVPSAPAEKSPDVVVKTVVEERLVSQPTKLITRPIRSGQQVYSEGDLIVMAQVSAGAEVLAAGNIHVYGALRGRALAGVKGDESARIFCKSMEAELVSIAGQFMLSDALQNIVWKEAAQVLLSEEQLQVAPL